MKDGPKLLTRMHEESPDFLHFIEQLGTALYRNHMIPDRQGSAAHENH